MAAGTTAPSRDTALSRRNAPAVRRCGARSSFQHHAIVGREPRHHALSHAMAIPVEPRGVGDRRAHHYAGVELYLVDPQPAEIADVGDHAFEPVDRIDR